MDLKWREAKEKKDVSPFHRVGPGLDALLLLLCFTGSPQTEKDPKDDPVVLL